MVTCNLCKKGYAKTTTNSSHSTLWYHLKAKHGIQPSSKTDDTSALSQSLSGSQAFLPSTSRPTPPLYPLKKGKQKQNLLFTYAEKKSQEQMYAELTSVDRLSFNQVAKSEFIQSAMRDKKLVSHSSPTTIRKKVDSFYQTARTQVVKEITRLKESGHRFSITFDEWSGRNRRYMTINLHLKGGDWINLGMIRVWYSQKSET